MEHAAVTDKKNKSEKKFCNFQQKPGVTLLVEKVHLFVSMTKQNGLTKVRHLFRSFVSESNERALRTIIFRHFTCFDNTITDISRTRMVFIVIDFHRTFIKV